jgi:site-specific DNA-methyltransferase (adenine-specific)
MRPYYEHAGITIYHGDCREVLPGLTADVLVTDPPYGINFAGQPTKWQRLAGAAAEQWDVAAFDDFALLLAVGSAQCVWGGNYYPLPVSRGWMVWHKPDAPPSMSTVELAWTSRDTNATHIIHSISATNPERVGHPTQKPLRVMEWCVGQMPGGDVLDPFMGSGTTLVAAKNLGRKAIGIEIEERYCEIAAKRLAQEVLDLQGGA